MFIFSLFFSFFTHQSPLRSYEITVEGLSCFSYSYTDMESKKPLLVFVHGSPGDYSGWDKYLKDNDLQAKYRLLAIDRPGYGQSISQDTMAFPSLDFQVKVLRAFTKKYAHRQPVLLLGHSVGGPIVSLYTATYPDKIQALILLAPAISAQHEQPRFYNRLAQKRWFNKKIAHEMQISQIEMMHLPQQLEVMQPILAQITVKTWLFHGRLDMIAPYGNARYVQKNFINAPLTTKTYPFQNHFIPWTKFKEVKDLLMTLSYL
ncbi:MAG: hypothetical protein RLZZ292_1283 [Bacteroidota bacterium]